MNKPLAACALAVAAAIVACPAVATAEMPYLKPLRRAQMYNWHSQYAHTNYGTPISLVVPPTAQLQTNWSWGAPSMRVSRIDHQFTRNYPGTGGYQGPWAYTPHWPQDTAQFGVNYVRAPWYPTQR